LEDTRSAARIKRVTTEETTAATKDAVDAVETIPDPHMVAMIQTQVRKNLPKEFSRYQRSQKRKNYSGPRTAREPDPNGKRNSGKTTSGTSRDTNKQQNEKPRKRKASDSDTDTPPRKKQKKAKKKKKQQRTTPQQKQRPSKQRKGKGNQDGRRNDGNDKSKGKTRR
jgi:hypothetical protein